MQSSDASTDIEKAEKPIRDGYPSLAAWIAHDSDGETFVFRKFGNLGARNLLNIQSQLLDLEAELNKMDDEARQGIPDMEAKRSLRRWETFERHAKEVNRKEHKRMKIEMKMKEKIKEYHEALLLQAEICKLHRPRPRVLKAFKAYFKRDEDLNPILGGKAETLLDCKADLVALHPLTMDPLSSLVRDHWPFPVTNFAGSETTHFKDFHVRATVGVVNAIMAAILLIGAIVSLYYVKRPAAKLGIIGGFTTLFAATIAAFSRARRAEVFAASAAYAAVLVVFVSGNLGSG